MNQKLSENQIFFDKWSSSYDKSIFQFWMRRFYRPVFPYITTPGKVLDLSCGTGEFLLELNQLRNNTLYGIDYSLEMLSIARKKLKKVTLKQADVHNLPFKSNTFDYVVSTESFHHYYNQKRALSEIKRVTKQGGKIIIVDINFFLRPIHWLFEKFEPGCVKINSKKEFKTLFKEQKLKNILQHRSFLFSVLTLGTK